ncbi:MAG: hypothetical protein PUK16_03520 [Prevotellaceae bacterium]|nr:hypothetical protein [Prevotellaceae bacterium]
MKIIGLLLVIVDKMLGICERNAGDGERNTGWGRTASRVCRERDACEMCLTDKPFGQGRQAVAQGFIPAKIIYSQQTWQ